MEEPVERRSRYESGSADAVQRGHFGEEPGGYREVIRIAGPLILATGSLTLTLFVDRLFLAWHSEASVAAASPAGITYFTLCSLFMGTAQYVNSIVAQYHGAGDRPACARAVWQGIFFAIISMPFILACIPLGWWIFAWSAHGEKLVQLEQDYYTLLMMGGLLLPMNAALSSFFSGRGKTWTILWGNALGNGVNTVLAYVLIFGKLGLPELGIRGAGIATAISQVCPVIYWGYLFLSPQQQEAYQTRRQLRWDRGLFLLIVRYGIPAGLQLFLDVAAFALFVLLVGRLGERDLAVSNIVVSIEMLSFLPMWGMSIATATMVGQYIGGDKLRVAEKSVRSALKLAFVYMGIMSFLYLLFPATFLELFRSGAHSEEGFQEIVAKGATILRLVAVYSLFDTLFIIYSGALKGAGDTRFAMWAQVLLAWFVFVPPVYLLIQYFNASLTIAWTWSVVYVILLGLVFRSRYRTGLWKQIRMLNHA
ncbi:MAG: MATE family efflux transporter [Thermodesulfobacteriota bacterium]